MTGFSDMKLPLVPDRTVLPPTCQPPRPPEFHRILNCSIASRREQEGESPNGIQTSSAERVVTGGLLANYRSEIVCALACISRIRRDWHRFRLQAVAERPRRFSFNKPSVSSAMLLRTRDFPTALCLFLGISAVQLVSGQAALRTSTASPSADDKL